MSLAPFQLPPSAAFNCDRNNGISNCSRSLSEFSEHAFDNDHELSISNSNCSSRQNSNPFTAISILKSNKDSDYGFSYDNSFSQSSSPSFNNSPKYHRKLLKCRRRSLNSAEYSPPCLSVIDPYFESTDFNSNLDSLPDDYCSTKVSNFTNTSKNNVSKPKAKLAASNNARLKSPMKYTCNSDHKVDEKVLRRQRPKAIQCRVKHYSVDYNNNSNLVLPKLFSNNIDNSLHNNSKSVISCRWKPESVAHLVNSSKASIETHNCSRLKPSHRRSMYF